MNKSFSDFSLTEFSDALAADSAAPGGGSTAAIVAALAASLTAMVARLTVGRPKYAAVDRDMQRIIAAADPLRLQAADAGHHRCRILHGRYRRVSSTQRDGKPEGRTAGGDSGRVPGRHRRATPLARDHCRSARTVPAGHRAGQSQRSHRRNYRRPAGRGGCAGCGAQRTGQPDRHPGRVVCGRHPCPTRGSAGTPAALRDRAVAHAHQHLLAV
ncbi:MAG: cyclodeaminase/cyclohydrolase family protein [Anaerolineae bacterium]|nr:MAG: cyclodeaminase/cyclohydrolase family protein [Anaerolineae bacterium]